LGGPSGGCLTSEHLDVQIDYESLKEKGAMMGSGGVIVMNDGKCMVNVAKFFLDFCVEESCGKCAPCRLGLKQMLSVLDRITSGEAKRRHRGAHPPG
jgi:NADH:ubiquinone oxidoreductase subunit F (NADH-binding)